MRCLLTSRKIALLSLCGSLVAATSGRAQLSLGGGDQAPQSSQNQEVNLDAYRNGVAAIVNNDVITYDQVKMLTGPQEMTLAQAYPQQPDVFRQKVTELRTQAVKDLIDRQLILQEFKKLEEKGASIPDYVVDDHIQTYIRGEFNGNRAAFIRTLDAQGLTLAKFRQMEKDKIIVAAMRERQIKKDIFIPPKDVQDYYNQHIAEFSTPDSIHLRMISLAQGGATDATQKALAEEIRQKVISQHADFGNMAQFYSDDEHAKDKGDYGWVTRKDINSDLGKIAFSLKPGQISNIVESSGRYWLLYVEAKKPGGSTSFKDARIAIEQKLLQIEQQQEQEKWLAGLRKKAYIRTF
ncbi:MAG TPA: peptidyl-prolyl cis-trans isomerase [Chthoniobacteraceae bacterium]|nr:peptidyl-prolyl cis-trans isomerase [Chthoniobacteraceae bacterium]